MAHVMIAQQDSSKTAKLEVARESKQLWKSQDQRAHFLRQILPVSGWSLGGQNVMVYCTNVHFLFFIIKLFV